MLGSVRIKLAIVASALTAIAMACSSGSANAPADAPTAVPPPAASAPTAVASQPTATVAPQPTAEPQAPSAPVVSTAIPAPTSPPSVQSTAPSSDGGLVWTIEKVDGGAKPAIALLADGSPIVAYMLEAMPGFVRAATLNAGAWDVDTIADGYFYGPLDIATGPDGTPHVTYHDHQDNGFDPAKGDPVHAELRDGEWRVQAIFDEGHDGWDGRIFVDADGLAHISAIEPKEFNGDGLEYYAQGSDGEWTVEDVGSGPLTYMYATSVAVDAQGSPHITYYEQDNENLALASKSAAGWEIVTVDGEGSTGLFSDLIIDGAGRFHISYFRKDSDSSGAVMYATKASGDDSWEIREVGDLSGLSFGFVGARNITSIAVDSSGNPWIAYGDEDVVKLAVWSGDAWTTSTVAESATGDLGQIVSLALDNSDRPHLTYFEVTSKSPLNGNVMYATASSE